MKKTKLIFVVLSFNLVFGILLKPSDAVAGMPYVLFLNSEVRGAAGNEAAAKITVDNVAMFYFLRAFGKSAMQLEAEGLDGRGGTGSSFGSVPPIAFAERFFQHLDTNLDHDLQYLQNFMQNHGGQDARDPESGVKGFWPSSATFRLNILPWAEGKLPSDAKVLIAPGKTNGAFSLLKKVPMFLAGIDELVVAPFPAEYERNPKAFLQAQANGFSRAAQPGLINPTLTNVLPKGFSFVMNITPGNTYVYVRELMGPINDIVMPMPGSGTSGGVEIKTSNLVWHVEAGKTVLEIVYTKQLNSQVPFLTLTFGEINPASVKSSLNLLSIDPAPASGLRELGIERSRSSMLVDGGENFLPNIQGSFTKMSMKNGKATESRLKDIGFHMHIERLVMPLAPWGKYKALDILNPDAHIKFALDYPLSLEAKRHVVFSHLRFTATRFSLDTVGLDNKLSAAAIPAISQRVEGMLPKSP